MFLVNYTPVRSGVTQLMQRCDIEEDTPVVEFLHHTIEFFLRTINRVRRRAVQQIV